MLPGLREATRTIGAAGEVYVGTSEFDARNGRMRLPAYFESALSDAWAEDACADMLPIVAAAATTSPHGASGALQVRRADWARCTRLGSLTQPSPSVSSHTQAITVIDRNTGNQWPLWRAEDIVPEAAAAAPMDSGTLPYEAAGLSMLMMAAVDTAGL